MAFTRVAKMLAFQGNGLLAAFGKCFKTNRALVERIASAQLGVTKEVIKVESHFDIALAASLQKAFAFIAYILATAVSCFFVADQLEINRFAALGSLAHKNRGITRRRASFGFNYFP